ncbi:CLIP-associating protein 1-B [Lamellibrachia satsuma]|nr:CLIP-associating protein 1-B [Lamellibrachia satsuma]
MLGDVSGPSAVGSKVRNVRSAPPKVISYQTDLRRCGAMDEEMFQREFECVPAVTMLSARVLQDEFRKIHEELSDPVKDWRLRVGAAKQIRSLLIAGAANYPDFDNQLQLLDNCFKQCLQDLRSQVVREICITIMYCSIQLGSRFDHMAEALLPSLISLVSNSAKIMSTSAIVSIHSIIRNSRSARLVPLITCHLSSKAQCIRRESLGFLEVILHTWPTESLVKHSAALKNALSRGITDADAKARKHARKAFVDFMQHFKTEGDGLMVLLDRRMQKLLHSEIKQCQIQRGARHESGESVSSSPDPDNNIKAHTKAVNFYSGKSASDCGDNLENFTSNKTKVTQENIEVEDDEGADLVKQGTKVALKRAKSVPPMCCRLQVPQPSDKNIATMSEEALFLRQCEDVPPVRITSARDLTRRMVLIRATLSDCACAWEKRVEAARSIRALLLANAAEYIEFYTLLRKQEIALQLALKDTHLAVMREMGITLCFLSMRLGWRFDHCAEILLPTIVSLLLNPVKDIAMAATVTFRVIIQNTQSEKLIPIIVGNFSSKYSMVRRENYKAMAEVIENWPLDVIEDQMNLIEESLTSGINDPEPSVRAEARSAFYLFTGKYSQIKRASVRSHQPAHRYLEGVAEESDDAVSMCSHHSVKSAPAWERGRRGGMLARDRAQPRAPIRGSNYSSPSKNSCYTDSEYNGSCSAQYQNASHARDNFSVANPSHVEPYRSRPRSAIPIAQTSRRHKRAHSVTGTHTRLSPVLEEDIKEKDKSPEASCIDTDDVSLPAQICHSDNSVVWPETRETIPAHKTKSDKATSETEERYHLTPAPSFICTPTHTPTHTTTHTPTHTHSPTLTHTPTHTPTHNPHVRSCHTLQRNKPMERDRARAPPIKPPLAIYNDVLHRDMMHLLSMMSSSSWTERKEGLHMLQNRINSNHTFNQLELSKLSEVFTFIFLDPNERVYAMFVDTLAMLIEKHSQDLGGWLYMCLTRLLTKLSTDMMMNNLKSRVQKTLNTMRTFFAYDDQFKILLRFIIELEMQNYRLILIVLEYFNKVVMAMLDSEFNNSVNMRLATSRIIRWVTEPGSVEIRKVSLQVLSNMYHMNQEEFTNMLSELPRAFQESAAKMLHIERATLDQMTSTLPHRNVARKRMPHTRHAERLNPSGQSRSISEYPEDAVSTDSHGQYDSPDESQVDGTNMCCTGMVQDMGDASFDNAEEIYNSHFVGQPPKLLELIADLSMHERGDKVRQNLCEALVKLSQQCIADDTYLPNTIMCLLQILDSTDDKTRVLTLQTITELLRQPHYSGAISSLSEYAHDIIENIFHMHLDCNLRVKTAAEDCVSMLVRSLPPIRIIQVLIPIIERSKNLMQLVSINMMSETIKRLSGNEVATVASKIIPGLLKGYDSVVGNVRKASVYCLVGLHEAAGEEVIQPYLEHVSETKRKLLNVYIKRGT